jgi:hypothetical protein
MSAAWDDAEEQPSILGKEVSGQRGAGCVRHTSTAEDGLESHSGVGTRVEGPSAGGGEGTKSGKYKGQEITHPHPSSPKYDKENFLLFTSICIVVFGGRVPFRVGARRAEGVGVGFSPPTNPIENQTSHHPRHRPARAGHWPRYRFAR